MSEVFNDNFLLRFQIPSTAVKYSELRDEDHLRFKKLMGYINLVGKNYDPTDPDFSFPIGNIGNLTFKHVLDELGLRYTFDETRPVDFVVLDNYLIEVKNWRVPKGSRNTYDTQFKEKVTDRFYKVDPDHEKAWYLVINPDLWDRTPTDLNKTIREECEENDIHLIRMAQVSPKKSKDEIRRVVRDLRNDVAGILDENNASVSGATPWEINSRIKSQRDEGRCLAIVGEAENERSYTASKLMSTLSCRKIVIANNQLTQRFRYENAGAEIIDFYEFWNRDEDFQDPIFVFGDVGKKNGLFINNLISEKKETGAHYLVVTDSYEALRNSVDPKLVDALVVFKKEDEKLPFEVEDETQEELSKSIEALAKRQYSFLNVEDQMIAEKRNWRVNILKSFLDFEDQQDDYRYCQKMTDEDKRSADYSLRAWQGGSGKKWSIIRYLENDGDPLRRNINREIAEHNDWDYQNEKDYIKKVKYEWKKSR